MSMQDDEITKLYYSIGEVSEMFDVSKSLIRFWEAEFDILKPHKNSKGDRRFTQKNLDQFKIIYNLVKVRGFTLDGAKREISSNKDNLMKRNETLKTLENLKEFLEKMQGEL